MGVCNCSMFCCTLLYVHSSFAIILMGKRELVALLSKCLPSSTANIKALRGSLGALSVKKLSHIPKLQPISAVYENQ